MANKETKCDKYSTCKCADEKSITCTQMNGNYYSLNRKCGAYHRQ